MKVTSSSKYVFHCVPINRTSFCTEDSARQPFYQLWWKILKIDLHISLPPLPKPALNVLAHFTLPFVQLPMWGGDFLPLARIHVLSILMSFPLRAQVPSKLEWNSSYPSFVRLLWLGHIWYELYRCRKITPRERWNMECQWLHKYEISTPGLLLGEVSEITVYHLLSACCLTNQVLNTIFCLVETALNSRPIANVCAKPSIIGALTPT